MNEQDMEQEASFILTITKVDNGFVLNGEDYHAVCEEGEGEFGEIEAGGKMLWSVIEHFGMGGSRHDAKRLRVIIEPGDKYVGEKPKGRKA